MTKVDPLRFSISKIYFKCQYRTNNHNFFFSFWQSWLVDRQKAQRDDRISQTFRINELHCNVKPVFGQEVLDFLTFLPGSSPTPAQPNFNSWSRLGYSSCLIAQSQDKRDYLDQSKTLREVINSFEDRLHLMSEVIDRWVYCSFFKHWHPISWKSLYKIVCISLYNQCPVAPHRFTFVIPPVEAKSITMHSCHPPPSLSYQQTLFSSTLSATLSPLMHTLHRIRCNMRTHFPDLRLIQYDCGK